jgi:hypothetical protein
VSVTDTSHSAFEALRDSLPRRERLVWDALAACSTPPTAYELERQMARAGNAFDLNSVRPRLTALHAKGCVRWAGKRKCTVTGKRAYTWQAVLGHPPVRMARVSRTRSTPSVRLF